MKTEWDEIYIIKFMQLRNPHKWNYVIFIFCKCDFKISVLWYWKKGPFLRTLSSLRLTDPTSQMPLNLIGPDFYTCFHVPSSSPFSHAVSKSMLLPCWNVFQVQILIIIMVLLTFALLVWLNLIEQCLMLGIRTNRYIKMGMSYIQNAPNVL